jgi:hypothetical protein
MEVSPAWPTPTLSGGGPLAAHFTEGYVVDRQKYNVIERRDLGMAMPESTCFQNDQPVEPDHRTVHIRDCSTLFSRGSDKKNWA